MTMSAKVSEMKAHAGRRSSIVLLAVAATLAPFPVEAADAEVCYRDDTGRIVKRRRPGYVEVPCPVEGQPTLPTQSPTDEPQSTGDTGRGPRRQVIERAAPAYV